MKVSRSRRFQSSKRKLTKTFLLGFLCLNILSGCGKKQDDATLRVNPFNYQSEFKDDNFDITNGEEEIPEIFEATDVFTVDTVVAKRRTAIYENADGTKLRGYLLEGKSLELTKMPENGYYQVNYYDIPCYVKEEDVDKSFVYDVDKPINKVLFALDDKNLVIPNSVSESGENEVVTIPKNECFEVYAESDMAYFVQTRDYIGYITKDNLEEKTGVIIVADISEQDINVYKDNVVIYRCPMVSGEPTEDKHSDEGMFEIYQKEGHRYLSGADYNVPVSVVMFYNGGEGIHDAERYPCDECRNHGWRRIDEFGADFYLNGSHGCLNVPHDAVMTIASVADVGTPVIVKK